ncbi:MAG: acyltransferase [Hyphomicrobiales bacterium]|nr:acyltransferase [Hyphomicrobiales bacterium]
MRDEPLFYRKDIDGWRAIAVVAVILNHFDKAWLPGGYLGVDVFFVISGFVITMALLNRKAERFWPFLADFYARRVRRLMPALAVCVVATSVAIWFADPASRQSLSTGLGALFGVSNLLLANQDANYFSPSTELNAFTHTWSLGVEEQFYLVYPLLLWGLARLGARQDAASMRRFVLVLAAMLVISAGIFVSTANAYPVFNYYHLPSRFWELAAGALTFLACRNRPARLPAPVPLAATAVLAVTFLLPLEHRVPATLLAVAATAVLLATTPSSRALDGVLTTPVLRFFGRISYPLYLWHWSVLAVSRFTIGVSAATAPVQFALMLALAWGTYRFIESPLRHGWIRQPNWRVLTAGLGVALLCAAVPMTLRLKEEIGPFRSAASDVVPDGFMPLPDSGARFEDVCLLDAKHPRKADTVERCTVAPVKPDGNTIWAFGDSHAGHLQPMFYALREQTGMGVHVVAMANTPFPSVVDSAMSSEGQTTFDSVSPRFKPGDIVVLARFYLYRDGQQRAQPDVAAWTLAAADLARKLGPRGIKVVIVAPPPAFRYASVLSCARRMSTDACAPSRESLAGIIGAITQDLETATQGIPNVVVFRPFDFFCPPSQATCSPIRDGQMAFRDQDHLTVVGSRAMTGAFMERLGLEPAH